MVNLQSKSEAQNDGGNLESSDDVLTVPEKGALASFFSNVDVLRQISMIIGLLIVLAIVVILWTWGKEDDYRPLGTYKTDELIATLDFLDTQKVPYKIEGNSVLVIADQYQKTKLLMTRAGLAQNNDETGDDILLKDMGFGVSQRVEQERLKLSRERQLSIAIQSMKNINQAQVLLAIPKQSVFARKDRQASATVVITTARSYALSPQEIDSIVDIVASAVQGLSPNSITVTDQGGRLLHSGSQNGRIGKSSKEFALERDREEQYKAKMDTILIPILGIANYTSEVDLVMDFTIKEETKKTYDPLKKTIRSEFVVESNSNGNKVGNVPGALSNQPPKNSQIPEKSAIQKNISGKGSGSGRVEATRNYEVDTTVTTIKHKIGKIDKITVSVGIDYVATKNADGKTTYAPRDPKLIANIKRLLIGALGINKERGDLLEIASVDFNHPNIDELAAVPIWKTETFQGYVRFSGSLFIIILTLLLIVRPIMKKLLYPEKVDNASDYEFGGAISAVHGGNLDILNEDDDSGVEFGVGDGQITLPNLHKDEDLLTAVRSLVANEPGLSAQVIKEWLIQDEQ